MYAIALRDRPKWRNRDLQPVSLTLSMRSKGAKQMNHSYFLAALVAGSLTIALPAAAQNEELGAENYRQADANGDGVLAYAEFATFIDLNAADGLGNAARVSSRGMHARAFKRVDANGDGVVSPQELQAIQ
jgi:Ca2+-binding EF-hand superfamily protein